MGEILEPFESERRSASSILGFPRLSRPSRESARPAKDWEYSSVRRACPNHRDFNGLELIARQTVHHSIRATHLAGRGIA